MGLIEQTGPNAFIYQEPQDKTEGNNQDQRNVWIDPPTGKKQKGDIGRDQNEKPLGKIDKVHHPEDEGEPQGNDPPDRSI
jgi:hypothetical protein